MRSATLRMQYPPRANNPMTLGNQIINTGDPFMQERLRTEAQRAAGNIEGHRTAMPLPLPLRPDQVQQFPQEVRFIEEDEVPDPLVVSPSPLLLPPTRSRRERSHRGSAPY